jgi:hypothetical protein
MPLPGWKKGAEEEAVKVRRGAGKLVLCANGSVVTRTGGQGIHGDFNEEVPLLLVEIYHTNRTSSLMPCARGEGSMHPISYERGTPVSYERGTPRWRNRASRNQLCRNLRGP